ncbi:MAG: alanine--tRNA ligase [Patescibacteria group bacterium]
MTSREIRNRFLSFFERRGHAVIPSASLVPENDPSVLFTTAGMQPLVPYLLGTPHPKGKRLVNVQKCVRTQDIEEVGDNTHDTFFEMLGNWSLGDPASPDGIGEGGYFKEEAITWSYEFLTSKEEGLGLDPKRLYVTVFEGDENAPRDTESAEIWKSLGIPAHRIYYLPASKNWWSPGDNGPCGPDSEMFYDLTEKGLGDMTHEEYLAADDRQDVVEIWNDVFMEYEKKDGKVIGKLANKNVDTGAGLERLAMVLQGKRNVFDTDLFSQLMVETKKITEDMRAERVIADHMRTATMMIADGVTPSNTDRGYILRRLIRRAVVKAGGTLMPEHVSATICAIVETYKGVYVNVLENKERIAEEINREIEKFSGSVAKGMKEFEKLAKTGVISPVDAFILFSTYGFPIEMTEELAKERGIMVDKTGFETEFKKHQELSRAGAEQKFKGGLSDTGEKTTMLHTSTHLMLAGLRKFLGEHVHQAGSNITTERTRFDFTHPEKVPREILDKVEAYVNEAIGKGCAVVVEQMPKEKAKKTGVEGSFWEKYPDMVNVYAVKSEDGTVYSQELCGGPHVENTRTIKGTFKIIKEEASSAGVRRVKAVLE